MEDERESCKTANLGASYGHLLTKDTGGNMQW